MAIVAVAGGTGGVGKTIVGQLRQSKKHRVLVLSRKPPKQHTDASLVQHVVVNYDEIDATAKILEDNDVDTIISAITMEYEATSRAQLNLIEAAEKSKVTKRFIPSEYCIINSPESLKFGPSVQNWIDSADALKRSQLKYTRFVNGFFMDYWGMPHVRTDLSPLTWAIDVLNCKAAIPGDGEDVLSFTYSVDLARFLVRILDHDEWPEFSVVVGEDMTFNQLLRLAEKIRGTQFDVHYESEDMIQKGDVTVFPQSSSSTYSQDGLRSMMARFDYLAIAGALHMPVENRLNFVFEDIHPTSMEELLRMAWEGR